MTTGGRVSRYRRKGRSDFAEKTKRTILLRAGGKCSICKHPTVSAHPDNAEDHVSIGQAAHICAASEGGPRFDAAQTNEERASAANGIWLCATCHSKVDKFIEDYPPEQLREIKQNHEQEVIDLVRSHRFSCMSTDALRVIENHHWARAKRLCAICMILGGAMVGNRTLGQWSSEYQSTLLYFACRGTLPFILVAAFFAVGRLSCTVGIYDFIRQRDPKNNFHPPSLHLCIKSGPKDSRFNSKRNIRS